MRDADSEYVDYCQRWEAATKRGMIRRIWDALFGRRVYGINAHMRDTLGGAR